MQRGPRVLRRDVDQSDIRIQGVNPGNEWIGGGHRITRRRMGGAGHAGAVDQHLQYRTLLTVGRDDDYGKLRHDTKLLSRFRLLTVELMLIQERFRIGRPGGSFHVGRYLFNRAQHHQFGITLLLTLAFEKIAQNRDISQSRNLVYEVRNSIVHQARNHEALTILQFEFGVGSARTERRNGKTGDGEGIRKIKGADFRRDIEMNIAAGHDHRFKLQLDAKFLELNGDRGETLAGL